MRANSLKIAAMLAAGIAVGAWIALPMGPLVGHPRVIDGDTLDFDGRRVRLYGIDAPELGQMGIIDGEPWPCGLVAKQRLANFIGYREVRCKRLTQDAYGRILARCSVAGLDIGAQMVVEGYAFAYLYFTQEYEALERFAQRDDGPIFRAKCERPWQWRRAH